MPVYLKYDNKKDVLYVSMVGKVTIEEFQATIKQVAESAEFASDIRTLCDLRKIDFTSVDNSFLMKVVSSERENPKRANAKIAFIADDDLKYGIARMYQILADKLPKNITVFRDYSEGERWLLSEKET